MQPEIYKFWKDQGSKHIQPSGTPTLHEGWDATLFLRELFTQEEYGTVIDIGCGYGRLCTSFSPKQYLGLDFNQESINKAREENSGYKFDILNLEEHYPYSTTKILFYVLLHQCDGDIEYIVESLCKTSERIIVAEICGREWRREGNPPVFNRNVEEYINLFADYDKCSVNIINKPYPHYQTKYKNKNTDVSIMVFE